jgi:hypothetical protein
VCHCPFGVSVDLTNELPRWNKGLKANPPGNYFHSKFQNCAYLGTGVLTGKNDLEVGFKGSCFCGAKLNQRMHSSPPPKFGNKCNHLRERAQCYNFTYIQFYIAGMQFYIFTNL